MQNQIPATRVVEAARSWLGTPYVHQASLKGVGCDCLGLVRGVWRELQGREPMPLPNYSSVWSETGNEEQLLLAATRCMHPVKSGCRQPGDILVFRMRTNALAKHAGILCGDQYFIHAYQGSSVASSAFCSFWQRRVAGVFRFPFVEPEAAV